MPSSQEIQSHITSGIKPIRLTVRNAVVNCHPHLVEATVSLQRLSAVEHPLTSCDSAWGVHVEQSHGCHSGLSIVSHLE